MPKQDTQPTTKPTEASPSPTDTAVAAPKKKLPPLTQSTMWIIVALAFVGGGFGGAVLGKKLAESDSSTISSRTQNGPPMPDGVIMGDGPMMGGGGTIGKVTKASDSSITVTDQRSDKSETYKISDDTTITIGGDDADASDIAVGDTVMIRASDSSTASSIDINPTTNRR